MSLLRILISYFILSLGELFPVFFMTANRAQRKCSLSPQIRSVFRGLCPHHRMSGHSHP